MTFWYLTTLFLLLYCSSPRPMWTEPLSEWWPLWNNRQQSERVPLPLLPGLLWTTLWIHDHHYHHHRYWKLLFSIRQLMQSVYWQFCIQVHPTIWIHLYSGHRNAVGHRTELMCGRYRFQEKCVGLMRKGGGDTNVVHIFYNSSYSPQTLPFVHAQYTRSVFVC